MALILAVLWRPESRAAPIYLALMLIIMCTLILTACDPGPRTETFFASDCGSQDTGEWRTRITGQLARLTPEPLHSRAHLLGEPLAIAAIDWVTALTAATLAEGVPYPRVYSACDGLLSAIELAPAARVWAGAIAQYETLLLAELGYAEDYDADSAPVAIDVIGVGASPYDKLNELAVQVLPVNVAEAANQTDKSGMLRFCNLRSQLWWKFRELLDPVNGYNVALPPMTMVQFCGRLMTTR